MATTLTFTQWCLLHLFNILVPSLQKLFRRTDYGDRSGLHQLMQLSGVPWFTTLAKCPVYGCYKASGLLLTVPCILAPELAESLSFLARRRHGIFGESQERAYIAGRWACGQWVAPSSHLSRDLAESSIFIETTIQLESAFSVDVNKFMFMVKGFMKLSFKLLIRLN